MFLAALLRFGTGGTTPIEVVIGAVGVLGTLLSISWYVVIRSNRQLNTGKFEALHELEEKLGYAFFRREWELLGEGRRPSRYWRLTIVETGQPCIFALLFLVVVLYALLC